MFKNLFSFKGRIRRTEYAISLVVFIIPAFIINEIMEESEDTTTLLLLFAANIPLYWFIWSQGAKRCHDRGYTGWLQIVPFYVLWMLMGKSEDGINRYGLNPKEIGNQVISRED